MKCSLSVQRQQAQCVSCQKASRGHLQTIGRRQRRNESQRFGFRESPGSFLRFFQWMWSKESIEKNSVSSFSRGNFLRRQATTMGTAQEREKWKANNTNTTLDKGKTIPKLEWYPSQRYPESFKVCQTYKKARIADSHPKTASHDLSIEYDWSNPTDCLRYVAFDLVYSSSHCIQKLQLCS